MTPWACIWGMHLRGGGGGGGRERERGWREWQRGGGRERGGEKREREERDGGSERERERDGARERVTERGRERERWRESERERERGERDGEKERDGESDRDGEGERWRHRERGMEQEREWQRERERERERDGEKERDVESDRDGEGERRRYRERGMEQERERGFSLLAITSHGFSSSASCSAVLFCSSPEEKQKRMSLCYYSGCTPRQTPHRTCLSLTHKAEVHLWDALVTRGGRKHWFSDASRFSLQRVCAWVFLCAVETWRASLHRICAERRAHCLSVCFHPPCFTLDMLSSLPFGCSTIRCTKLVRWQTFSCTLCFVLKLNRGCG